MNYKDNMNLEDEIRNKDDGCGCGSGEGCECDENCDCGCQEGEPCSCGCGDGGSKLDAKSEEYLNMAKRVQADFDNYRKKSYEAMQTIRFEGIISVLEKVLPCLDSISKAKTMIQDEKVLEGINMIEKEMKNALYSLDVEEIASKGEIFNPKYHNVIAVVHEKKKEDGEIIEVAQEGFKIKDRVIRYAQVVINKKEDK